MKTLSVFIVGSACLNVTAFAVESGSKAKPNVFDAEFSHPAIEAAVNEFETTCLPFIAHETELLFEQDRAVFNSMMIEKGYVFETEKQSTQIVPLKQFAYAPTACPIKLPKPTQEGKHTIFHGESEEIRAKRQQHFFNELTSTSENKKSCEILMISKTPTRTTNFMEERYEKSYGYPVAAYLTWQEVPGDYLKTLPSAHAQKFGVPSTIKLRTSFPSASACQINTSGSDLSRKTVKDSIIRHDDNWTPTAVNNAVAREDFHLWTQCTTQDDQHYIYSVGLKETSLFVKVEALQNDEYSKVHNCKLSGSLN